MNKKNNKYNIIAFVGNSFDVILESMIGSTAYGWCLRSLPEGVILISTENIPVRKGVSPVKQIFTFAALKSLKKADLEFELLCLNDLTRSVADSLIYNIIIRKEKENDKLTSEIGYQKFLKGTGNMLHSDPVIPHGFPQDNKPLILYGYPNSSDLSAVNVIQSNTNCVFKYGIPYGVSPDDSECHLKYGFPVSFTNDKDEFPLTNTVGEQYEVIEDDNCVIKHGTPDGVGTSIGDCVLKYGFPRKR